MEEIMTTKEKIIYESLRLFSIKGYDGVSMRDIAAAVGIKGASLYNHFSGKEDIFNAIFETMSSRYENAIATMNISQSNNEDMINMCMNISETDIYDIAEKLLCFFCKDEFTVMFRKLLKSEQHKSPLAAKLYKQYYLEEPIAFQSQIFGALIKLGKFKVMDPEIMAIHFYSPIYYILSKNDLDTDFSESVDIIKRHVHSFCELYWS